MQNQIAEKCKMNTVWTNLLALLWHRKSAFITLSINIVMLDPNVKQMSR